VPQHLTITTASGGVVITGEDRADVVVEGKASIEQAGPDEIAVHAKSANLDVRCPAGTHVRVGTASGRVELRGRLGDARVTTKSSSIKVEEVDALELRSESGSIDVGICVGYCRLQTASGSVRVDDAGDVDISARSGSIKVSRASGGKVHGVSGSVDVGATGEDDLEVRLISGSVKVTVPDGVRPQVRLQSVSGNARCDCEEGDDCCIKVTSVSGSIQVVAE
jgi:DUF4097 and DUF4098 domain-containing protein YvlB